MKIEISDEGFILYSETEAEVFQLDHVFAKAKAEFMVVRWISLSSVNGLSITGSKKDRPELSP